MYCSRVGKGSLKIKQCLQCEGDSSGSQVVCDEMPKVDKESTRASSVSILNVPCGLLGLFVVVIRLAFLCPCGLPSGTRFHSSASLNRQLQENVTQTAFPICIA